MLIKPVIQNFEDGESEEDEDEPFEGDDDSSVVVTGFAVNETPPSARRCCCPSCCATKVSRSTFSGASVVKNLCPRTELTVSLKVVLESLVATATSSRDPPEDDCTISIN